MAGFLNKKWFCLLLVLFLSYGVSASARFLFDEKIEAKPEPSKEEPAPQPKKVEDVALLKKGGFLPNTALNIKVVPIPDLPGAFQISWDVSENTTDTFIVGRTTVLPSTLDVALSATSIKVVPFGYDRIVVDRNLPDGNYYYVILGKSRVADKSFELLPNENYNTNPVVVVNRRSEAPQLPDTVKGINAVAINQTDVLLSWIPIAAKGVTYTIYSSLEPFSTPDVFQKAKKIGMVYDSGTYVDKNINQSGTYFYAVTTAFTNGIENYALYTNENYTTKGVFISFEQQTTVLDIKADITDRGVVGLSWRPIPNFKGEYLLYRSEELLDSFDKISKSVLIDRLKGDQVSYSDYLRISGRFYYAILSKSDGAVKTDFVKNGNYISEPVGIGEPLRITEFKAIQKDGSVELYWKIKGDVGNKKYLLFRTDAPVKSIEGLESSYILKSVDATSLSYVDYDLEGGKYNYYILPADYKESGNIRLRKNVNYAVAEVKEAGEEEVSPEEISELPKKREYGSVDIIIADNFFKGRYKASIYYLKKFIETAAKPNDIAKAKLFIGKSYVEMGEYSTALKLFVSSDVKKYFKKESAFWVDYCYERMR